MNKSIVFGVWGLASVLLVLGGSNVRAATLALYDFSGSATSSNWDSPTFNGAATTVASNMTASDIAQAGAIGLKITAASAWSGNYLSVTPGNTVVNSVTPSGPQALSTATGANTAADAVFNGAYITFTFTAASGYVLDLSSLTFDVTKGGSGTRGFAMQIDLNGAGSGFSTNGSTNLNLSGTTAITALATPLAGSSFAVSTTKPAFSTLSLDLSSGTTYDAVSSLSVRIFGLSSAVANSVEFDNFTLNGSVVAVPEPSTFAMLGMGLGSLWFLRRKKKSV